MSHNAGSIIGQPEPHQVCRIGAVSYTHLKDSPLLTLDNFSTTPHIGGNTQEALYRTGMTVVQNVLDVLDGKAVSSMIV